MAPSSQSRAARKSAVGCFLPALFVFFVAVPFRAFHNCTGTHEQACSWEAMSAHSYLTMWVFTRRDRDRIAYLAATQNQGESIPSDGSMNAGAFLLLQYFVTTQWVLLIFNMNLVHTNIRMSVYVEVEDGFLWSNENMITSSEKRHLLSVIQYA